MYYPHPPPHFQQTTRAFRSSLDEANPSQNRNPNRPQSLDFGPGNAGNYQNIAWASIQNPQANPPRGVQWSNRRTNSRGTSRIRNGASNAAFAQEMQPGQWHDPNAPIPDLNGSDENFVIDEAFSGFDFAGIQGMEMGRMDMAMGCGARAVANTEAPVWQGMDGSFDDFMGLEVGDVSPGADAQSGFGL
jgi:hypothetical protein